MGARACPRSGVSEEGACGLELADVLGAHGQEYRHQHSLSRPQLRAMRAIETCRTPVLGGHLYKCKVCGAKKVTYNSCRNRHCPKCQALDKARWLEERSRELLPVPYFQVVFTLPEELNALTLVNARRIYTLLFDSASQALLELAADPKHLGAKIGFFAALHTWGQALQLHPHLHCVVPGGGLSLDRKSWVSSRKDFFLPVLVLGALFRGKFLAGLKAAFEAGHLKLPESLPDPAAFQALLDALYAKRWVVHSEPPIEGPEGPADPQKVVDYLARYIYRVAISNSRLVRMDDEGVTFTYKDYRQDGKVKEMTLPAEEFIRRFLLHVLPERFVRIRYYGFLSPRRRERDLALCRELLGAEGPPAVEEESWQALLTRLTGKDPTVCESCGKGHLLWVRELSAERYRGADGRSPP